MPGRKISVELVGDAGDLERSLAGALASLKAFGDGAQKSGNKANVFSKSTKDGERALYNFDKAASKVNKTMSGGPLGLFDALGNVGYAMLKVGSLAQKGGDKLGDFLKPLTTGEAGLTGFGSALGQLAPLLGVAAGAAAVFGAALLVLPAIVGAVTFVLVALLDVLTTLGAVAASLAGPLVVVTGLLGGLGAAFAFVAVQSFKNQATQQQLHDNLLKLHVAQQTYNQDLAKYGKNATQTENALLALHKAQDAYETSQFGVLLNLGALQDKFRTLVHTLGIAFRPELLKLAGAANTALTYLNRIAKLPLAEAFQSLGTKGVAMLSKFVYGVANVLKRPFRLAIQIAFGTGGQNAQAAITNWWDSLTGYLFGYSQRHPIKLGDHVIGFSTKQVSGALQPVLAWFNRQHFTKTAVRWSNEILNGFEKSGGKARLAEWAGAIAAHAGHIAGKAFSATLEAELRALPGWVRRFVWHEIQTNAAISSSAAARLIISHLGKAWDWVKSKASGVWNAVKGLASGAASAAGNAVKNAIGGAWDWVRRKAVAVWNAVKTFVESALTVHINWPSPPSWLSKLGGGAGSLLGGAFSRLTATGGIVTSPQVRVVGEAGPEAIIPLTGAAGRSALTQIGGGGGGQPMQVNLVLDRRVIASVLVDAEKTYRRQNAGRSLFAV